MVYVQVVTIAVYTYFLTAIIAKQPIHIPRERSSSIKLSFTSNFTCLPTCKGEGYEDLHFLDNLPLLITLEFIFYMGWLKVAETMINPFGEDDDDFEVNHIIDRNLIMSYLIVDEMHNDHPELLKDQYWDEIPDALPDRARTNSRNEQNGLTDFFEVEERPSILRQRKTTIILPADAEKQSFMTSPIASKAELIPRSSVIDETYRKVSKVEVTQSVLEKQMQKIREKIVSNRESDSDSSSSDDVKIV